MSTPHMNEVEGSSSNCRFEESWRETVQYEHRRTLQVEVSRDVVVLKISYFAAGRMDWRGHPIGTQELARMELTPEAFKALREHLNALRVA